MSASKRPAPPQVAGPAENAAARKHLAAQDSAARSVVTPLPLSWARSLIEAADGPVPEYGSAEWVQLPHESRAKVAACVMAAERYRTRHRQADVHLISRGRRAREITEARRPRSGDYMGGPVLWDEVADA